MSQAEHVLWHLQVHRRIDPLEALHDYGCLRLAARIAELRARGYEIETLTSPDGYAVYELAPAKPAENEQRALWGDR